MEHSQLHAKFIDLLEGLLEGFLQQLGIAPEQFAEICQEAVSKNLSELIQSQILAMDDFLTFKKMMIKANMELELQAVRSNARKAAAPAALPPTESPEKEVAVPEGVTDEEAAQIAEAIRLSQQMESLPSPSASSVEEAMKRSEQDEKIRQAEMKNEEAELEMAMAMSMALEEERVRQEAEAAAALAAAAAVSVPAPVPTPVVAAAPAAPAPAAPAPAAPAPAAPAPAAPAPAPVAPAPAPAAAEPAALAPVKQAPPPLPPVNALPPIRAPLEARSKLPAVFGASTSQAKLKEEVRQKQAELLAKQATDAQAAQSADEKKAQAEAELKRRQEYLQEQRNRIKAQQAAAAPEPWTAPHIEKPSEASPAVAAAPAEPQYDMKRALAQRFKQDMLKRAQGQ